eukprot:TRINITY_DN56266_c0_g1_i1.p1 TRINITY_DN56266_c0_g1~~TRINITY_DN56266_c0_g1_i1.p1  ORF type:complete len:123 (-),score=24.13 TRINITY_DN56266_c0_g1_i1:2-319(-)
MPVNTQDLHSAGNIKHLVESSFKVLDKAKSNKLFLGFCMYCQKSVEKKDWRVLKCRNARCSSALCHFVCLGFPDVSVRLANLMKQEYSCRVCSARESRPSTAAAL